MASVYERLKGTIESEFAVGGPSAGTKLTAEASGTAAKLALAEDTANGSHTISLQAPSSLAASISLTLPAEDGAAAGYDVMQSDGNGVLSFTDRRVFDRIRVDSTQGQIDTTSGDLTLAPAGSTQVTGSMTISGNLTVQGSTTTVESTNLSIEDSVIELARGNSDGSASHIGIKGERGSAGDDAYMVYVEGDDRWHAMTSSDGSNFSDAPMQASRFHGPLTGDVTGDVTGNVTGNVTGQVSDVSNHDTDDIAEGSTNLYYTTARWDTKMAAADTDDLSEGSTNQYFTQARARTSVSVTDAGGDGSLSYNNTTGVLTYTGPSASEVRAHLSVTDTNSMDLTFSGGAISADAKVDNSSIEVDATNGMQVKALGVTNSMLAGSIASSKIAELNAFDTDGLSEGLSNLYHTTARARGAVSATDAGGDGSFSYDSSTGAFTYTGPSSSEVRAHFSAGEGIDISDGEIAAELASTTNKGVAQFDANAFSVVSGTVDIQDGGILNAHLAGSIANAKLANSTVSYGGVQLALGASDATPAFDLSDATAYPGDSSLATVGTITSGTWQGTAIDGDYININGCDATYGSADFIDTDFMIISDGGTSKKIDLATLLGNTERVVKLEVDASSSNIAANSARTELSSKLLPAGSMITRVLAQVDTAASDLSFEVGRSDASGNAQTSTDGETDLFFDDMQMGATGTYVEQQITTSSASGTRKLQLTVSNSSGSTVTAGKVTVLVFFTEMPAV